jgi:hypothetical protein
MKNLFKLLLVLAIFGTTDFLATTPTVNIEAPPFENFMPDLEDGFSLEINSVNLSMENSQNFWLDEATPIDISMLEKLHTRELQSFIFEKTNEFQKKKINLFVSRIKEYLPDFNIDDQSRENLNKFHAVLAGNETHYYLKHKGADIRLITFIKKETPIDFSPDNRSASITVEENYY